MTIKEVAELAGVSPAAVSRYMNGGSISGEKSERIRAVIEQTGYRPNPLAQTMRTGRAGQIGVIIPKVYSDSVAQILEGVSDRLREKNYMTMLGVTDGKRENELRYIEAMQNSPVDGIILMGTVMTPMLHDAIVASAKPVVVTGQNFAGIPGVYHDDYNAMHDLAKKMIEKGRRHIAYIGATEDDVAVGKLRHEGAAAAWKEAGLNPDDMVVRVAEFNSASGLECMEELLTYDTAIDGVLCATDRIALGAMEAIRRAGKRIPEDISIAGVGDNWADLISTPKLTTVHLYYKQCGITAADMLLRRLENDGDDVPVTQTRLEYTIVERESL